MANGILAIESTGESVPSIGGESIIILRVKEAATEGGTLTCDLPLRFNPIGYIPTHKGDITITEKIVTTNNNGTDEDESDDQKVVTPPRVTVPATAKVGDRFFVIGHY